MNHHCANRLARKCMYALLPYATPKMSFPACVRPVRNSVFQRPARRLAVASGLLASALLCATAAQAQLREGDANRGRLLYENHCTSCHTSQAHVRENRKASSLKDLHGWVGRWQAIQGLNWTNGDIRDVATWLYLRFYDPNRPQSPN